MPQNRTYDMEYKVQAVKLALEIGTTKAARELDIPANTLHTWMRQYRLGNLSLGAGTQTPQRAMTLSEEIQSGVSGSRQPIWNPSEYEQCWWKMP